MKKTLSLILMTSALAVFTAQAGEDNCERVASRVVSGIKSDQSEVLNIVSREVSRSPGCACEIVKSAIMASKGARDTNADSKLVGQIVEVAISAAPDQMRLIVQCATSVAPDAVSEINEAVKTAGGVPQAESNPLEFPGDNESSVDGGSENSGSGEGAADEGTGSTLPVNAPAVTDPNP